MCFELGLHQQETYEHHLSSNAERYRATVLFWSIYVLDRRWSFGTGLPFVIEELDIDTHLFKPVSPLHLFKKKTTNLYSHHHIYQIW
jgi:hypothetical protein